MIGFVVTTEAAAHILAAIKEVWKASGETEPGWTPGSVRIFHGEHKDKHFIPFADSDMQTILGRYGIVANHPAFPALISSMGGLDARVDLDPAAILPPEEP